MEHILWLYMYVFSFRSNAKYFITASGLRNGIFRNPGRVLHQVEKFQDWNVEIKKELAAGLVSWGDDRLSTMGESLPQRSKQVVLGERHLDSLLLFRGPL